MIITNNETTNKLDEMKSSNRHRKDEAAKIEDSSEIEMLIRELCLVNENEYFRNGNENNTKNFIDALKLKVKSEKDKKKANPTSEKKSSIHM